MKDKSGFETSRFYKEIDLDHSEYLQIHIKHGNEVIALDSGDMWYALDYLVSHAGVGFRYDRETEDLPRKYRMLERQNDKLREAAEDTWELFLKHGAVSSSDLPDVDRVREALQGLGIGSQA